MQARYQAAPHPDTGQWLPTALSGTVTQATAWFNDVDVVYCTAEQLLDLPATRGNKWMTFETI